MLSELTYMTTKNISLAAKKKKTFKEATTAIQ